MVAPGVWQDMGPGAAITASSRQRIETGRVVGQMVPGPASGADPSWTARKAKDPGVNERRKARKKG